MRERVLTTLDHCEPDTVPLTDLSIDPPHMKTPAGRKLERDSSRVVDQSTKRTRICPTLAYREATCLIGICLLKCSDTFLVHLAEGVHCVSNWRNLWYVANPESSKPLD